MPKYNIAGLTVAMDTFGRTEIQGRPYLSCREDPPQIVIRSDWRALQAAQPHLTEDDCEYLSTGGSFYRQLLQFQGMVLHASAVVRDGRAYLFTAPSGTGKSTHTRLWLDTFPDAFILNDDKPAIRMEGGVFFAYGTPWSGKNDCSRNVRVPLAGICVLRRGTQNQIAPYTGRAALRDLLEQTVRPRDAQLTGKLLETLDLLLTQIPVWRLECDISPEAALLSWKTMSRKDTAL